MRKYLCLLTMVLFAGVAAYAQDTSNKLDVYAGYSYVRESPSTLGFNGFNLHGGNAAVTYKTKNWLGLVGDFGGYHAARIAGTSVSANEFTYMGGPRVSHSYNSGERGGFTPYAQVLFGLAHTSANLLGTSGSQNAFAMSLGGGVDTKISDRVSWRAAQVEYLPTRFRELSGPSSSRRTQNDLRVSTGLVFHF
ncbi:MAG TPA: outer membrane beta-barrel protein [Candidatus Acidoferrales bacterium]|nr:outer membrane beta-barrel protein [Candidatus Acidoferrales bacterium]